MTAARYWRVRTKTNGGQNYVAIGEMEFREVPGGADQCVVGQSQSSGHYDNSNTYQPNNAVDNSTSTAWISTNGQINNVWVDNDIGSGGINVKEILEIAITAHGSWLTAAPRTGVIDYSDDRVDWVPHTSFTLAAWTVANQVQLITVGSTPEVFPPVEARVYGAQIEAWNTGPADTPAQIYAAQAEVWNTGPASTPAQIFGAQLEIWATSASLSTGGRRRRAVVC